MSFSSVNIHTSFQTTESLRNALEDALSTEGKFQGKKIYQIENKEGENKFLALTDSEVSKLSDNFKLMKVSSCKIDNYVTAIREMIPKEHQKKPIDSTQKTWKSEPIETKTLDKITELNKKYRTEKEIYKQNMLNPKKTSKINEKALNLLKEFRQQNPECITHVNINKQVIDLIGNNNQPALDKKGNKIQL